MRADIVSWVAKVLGVTIKIGGVVRGRRYRPNVDSSN